MATDLHLFRYGPKHHELRTTEQLLHTDREVPRWIIEYRWTEETVTGSETGRVARVWVWVHAE